MSFGSTIGKNTSFKRSLYFDNTYEDKNSTGDFRHLEIGANCYVGDCVYFDLSNKIIIGDNVIISGNVSFVTHSDCNRSKYLDERFPRVSRPIRINNDVWVGFSSNILEGVTVGHNSVIAASSLVRHDIEPYAVYAGVPALKIRENK